jgi:hypothetical protein
VLFGGEQNDALPERGRLGSRTRELVDSGAVNYVSLRIAEIRRDTDGLLLVGEDGTTVGPVDEIVCATGFRPDLALTRELRLDLDAAVEAPSALAPLIDPNVHSCGLAPPHGAEQLKHPEPDLYTVGMKSYGRAPTFLLLTGYEQVRSVVAAIGGDWESARNVELVLPETGVCSTATRRVLPAHAAAHQRILLRFPPSTRARTCCCPCLAARRIRWASSRRAAQG